MLVYRLVDVKLSFSKLVLYHQLSPKLEYSMYEIRASIVLLPYGDYYISYGTTTISVSISENS